MAAGESSVELKRDVFLKMLRVEPYEVRFGSHSCLDARFRGVARALADMLDRALAPEEIVRYGVHYGELRRAPSRDEGWQGEITWFLATSRAVIVLAVKATTTAQGTTTAATLRHYPLATLEWSEIEETHAPGGATYILKLYFAAGEVALDSLKVEGRESDREAVREFAALIVRGPQPREDAGEDKGGH